jgi:hypothetical protein
MPNKRITRTTTVVGPTITGTVHGRVNASVTVNGERVTGHGRISHRVEVDGEVIEDYTIDLPGPDVDNTDWV